MTNFKPFLKIGHIGKLKMSITQKLHGTNAQIYIEEDNKVHAGSRSRWLTPEDDNYGFAKFVESNKQELIDLLGPGYHYGEWCGKGINSGEGLDKKLLCLFNWRRWRDKELPSQVFTVPLLYEGKLDLSFITETMERLKENGSYLAPGFMHPEGIVIEIDGQLYKNVFDEEETKWTKKITPKEKQPKVDIGYLLQPKRLEKLFSRDESYLRDFPTNLGQICKDYIKDLQEENQFIVTDEEDFLRQRKQLGQELFFFVKSIVKGLS